MDNAITTFVQRAINCQIACNVCFDACLEENEVKMLTECIRRDRECADICGIAADFVSRKGTLRKEILEACIKSCVECAQECEKHEHMDHCRDCAIACNDCADACRAIR